jgi:DNA mismatch repair protein MutS2
MADIGDEQSIEQNLSTFSSHMTRISKIFKEIDEKSLILLDEVGSGTDPKEGASLAISIIDKLTNLNARVITTTHYGDLKVYAYNNKNIVNASVEFNQDTLAPTYKLSIGVPGASNAISISRRLGLPDDILDNAKKLVEGNTTESGKIIQKIDEENQNVIKLRESYEAKIKELENKQKKLDEELADYNKNRELMLYKAHLEANQIINDAKKKSSELLEKLNQIKDQKNIQDKDLADVKFEAKNIAAKKPENHDQHEFVVGELCHVINYGKVGQILEIKKGKYVVQVGQFKMTFNRDEIQYDKSLKKQEEIKPKRKPTVSLETQQAPMRLDLRGERYVDVATQVDLFIDRAILARYHTVYIIHGFGTGAVRKAVYEALKLNKNVKETRFGGEGEGLNGCTVVTLK